MQSLLRAFLVILLFVAVGFLALGFWSGSRFGTHSAMSPNPVGTSGTLDVERARERGAEVGEKAAVAAHKVGESMEDAALTTKIKAKMALDDSVRARAIDVSTNGNVVTLSGTVGSKTEHDRALSLARETSGVNRVIDHLEVR